MINNLFDKHIKDKMGNSRPDVPAHVWENIIAKKDKIKPLGLWSNNISKMLGAVVLILASIGGVIYMVAHKNISKDTTDATSEIIKSKNNNNLISKNPTSPTAVDVQKAGTISLDINLLKAEDERTQNNKIIQHNAAVKMVIGTSIGNVELVSDDNNEQQLKYARFLNPLLLKNNLFTPGLQKFNLPKSPIIPCPEMEKNTAGGKTYFEIYGGPDYVFSNLSDTANSAYLQKRKASTKYLFAYSVGLRYTKVFGSGMSFRTGINYSQINEQFKAESGRIAQNVYIINNAGDTTGTYVQTSTKYKTSTNIYRSIDIPISVGYEMGNGRLHTNINAGAIINISSTQKGFMLDKNGNTLDISSGKPNSVYQYKTKAGVSFMGAVTAYYKVNEHLHILAEPYIKFALSPATKPEISLKEKFHTAGIRFGVRMDF